MFTEKEIRAMSYVQLMANISEVNRPPGGKNAVRIAVQNCFLTSSDKVLDVGCNTGFVTFEIAHLTQCDITGVDISPDMIKAANLSKETDDYADKIRFQVADGMNLPFKDNEFDAVISGGSTAFIPDIAQALKEYTRVVRPWGFVADINFYYHKTPPRRLLKELNEAMDINIQPWEKQYWLDIYKNCGLELYYTYDDKVYVPSKDEITRYCKTVAAEVKADPAARTIIVERLQSLMTLFAENHEYLSYSVFIMRKRPTPEQVSLFGA